MIVNMDKKRLLDLDPWHFNEIMLTPEDLWYIFTTFDAAWIYEGEPDAKKPHAVYNGKCSSGYINCRKVLCHPNLCQLLAIQFVGMLKRMNWISRVDWVVGSAYGSITWSYEVARALNAQHAFVEKDPADSSQKKTVWRESIPSGSKILIAEEIVATPGAIDETSWSIRQSNPHVPDIYPFVSTLVHQQATEELFRGGKVVSLIQKLIKSWDPVSCPYCNVGSQRIRPERNWDKLVGSL